MERDPRTYCELCGQEGFAAGASIVGVLSVRLDLHRCAELPGSPGGDYEIAALRHGFAAHDLTDRTEGVHDTAASFEKPCVRKTWTSLRPPTVTYAKVPSAVRAKLTWLVSGPVSRSMNDTEFEPIETTASARESGEKPRPCTSNWPRYSGLRFPGAGSPRRIR